MKNLITKNFDQQFFNFLKMTNSNKNFIISHKLYYILHNNSLIKNLKHIKYKDLISYINNNKDKQEILFIDDFLDNFGIKEKEINNIINFKTYKNKKIKFQFVFFIKNKIEIFYNNSYFFI